MDDITVDLGPISLDMAKTLMILVNNAATSVTFWDRDHFSNCIALKAMLTYRIAKAERVAEFVEPS